MNVSGPLSNACRACVRVRFRVGLVVLTPSRARAGCASAATWSTCLGRAKQTGLNMVRAGCAHRHRRARRLRECGDLEDMSGQGKTWLLDLCK